MQQDTFQKFHISVKALLVCQNEFLVLNVGRQYKNYGKLDLPGGRVNHDEIIEDVLIRELKEEIGLEIDKKVYELVGLNQRYNYFFYEQDKVCMCEIYYLVNIAHKPEIILSEEHMAYEWISNQTDLSEYEFKSKSHADLISKFQKTYCK